MTRAVLSSSSYSSFANGVSRSAVFDENWLLPSETRDLTTFMQFEPAFVTEWRSFLATVDVRGPIPMRFDVVHWPRELPDRRGDDEWILRWEMCVPSRDTGEPDVITFQNKLPDDGRDKRMVVRQCVLGAFQHEALESIYIDGVRAFDPHDARWYSNLVADWRCVP